MSVSHILRAKGTGTITGKSTDKVRSIAQTLAEKRIGAIVIVNATGGGRLDMYPRVAFDALPR